MRIGYSKLGRSWNVNPARWSTLGGDADVWRTLWYLATRNPQHEFVLVGRNTCENPQEVGLPPNVVNPWTERQPELRRQFNAAGINHPDLSIDEDRIACRILFDMISDQFLTCDSHVVWCGQHGTSSAPIRQVKRPDLFTHPQDSTIYYCSYVVYGINAWRDQDPLNREEVWLCPDVRNYIKARDIRWPLRNSVVAQYDQTRTTKYERFSSSKLYLDSYGTIVKRVENDSVWVAETAYSYDALELTALPDPRRVPLDLETERKPFGMVVNENRKEVSRNRLGVMEEWVLPHFPDAEIWGKWSPKSQEALGLDIEVCPYDQLYDTLGRYYCTLTTPASGSGWATSKPWESFLAGAVCFAHPYYDNQGHIVPTREQMRDYPEGDRKTMFRWLRPPTPEKLAEAVRIVSNDRDTWRFLATQQRLYVEETFAGMQPIKEIERRCGLS
jgi:hypothetical protein